jgi:hypothetical protein
LIDRATIRGQISFLLLRAWASRRATNFSQHPTFEPPDAAANETIDKMRSTGGLKAFSRAFKEARKADPLIRYFDYIHARKTAMLEALAVEAIG